MGKQWKQDGKMAKAAQKGAQFTKLAKEITVAAKLGGGDPDMNSRLRLAIDAARSASCPKDTIERAIKRGSGEGGEADIEEITYEGYAPHGVGVIVECQTDNRNRTASDIRFTFKKHNGNLGEMGSVAWMFERICLVEAKKNPPPSDPEEEAIEAGASEVEAGDENSFVFFGGMEDLDGIRTGLTERGWEVSKAELSYKATNPTKVDQAQAEEVIAFLEALDENEDTHRIHATLETD